MSEIKFKNGSKIIALDEATSHRGYRWQTITIVGKPKLRDRWLDFVLKIKSLLN